MPKQPLPDVEEGDEQRRDAMLLKLLKTPPKPRTKRKEKAAEPAQTGPAFPSDQKGQESGKRPKARR
jgi:hypothetical protein